MPQRAFQPANAKTKSDFDWSIEITRNCVSNCLCSRNRKFPPSGANITYQFLSASLINSLISCWISSGAEKSKLSSLAHATINNPTDALISPACLKIVFHILYRRNKLVSVNKTSSFVTIRIQNTFLTSNWEKKSYLCFFQEFE